MNPIHLRSAWRIGALAGLLPLDVADHPWRLALAAALLVAAELMLRRAPAWQGGILAAHDPPDAVRAPAPDRRPGRRRGPVPCHDWARERRVHPHHRRGLLGERHR